jgi:anaerobic selenocysteine-containing dehydrogenase
MKSVKTYCKICNCRCGIEAFVENGKIVKIKGDLNCQSNLGALCVKGRNMLEFEYDPDRLLHPLKRNAGSWSEIPWDQALEDVAQKLNEIKLKYGPESVAFFRGMSVYSWLYPTYYKRLINLFGSPNLFSNAALCIAPKIYSNKFTFGPGISTCGDFLNAKCILLFGANPAISGMHRAIRVMPDIIKAKKNGAKLIVIDPKFTETAAKADIWSPIRPGTDTALIYGLINVIIDNEWYDKDFIKKYVTGFEELKNAVKEYTPEKVEIITWVRKEIILKIAEVFSKSESACADRREGIFHQESGMQTCRAINYLNIITGNIDKKGGIVLEKDMFGLSHPKYDELMLNKSHKPKAAPITADNKITQDIPTYVIDAILKEKPYPIKALVVLGCNPVLSWPNTEKVVEAFKKLEFVVVIDIYRNDTASFSDYVLPAATFLEKLDLSPQNVAIPKIIQLQRPVVEPLGESKSEMWIIKELAKKMGYGEYFKDDERIIIDTILEPWGLSYDTLDKSPSGLECEPYSIGHYHSNPFPTKTGKIEIYSKELEAKGVDPIPVFKEPSFSSSNTQFKDYPLILVTGQRVYSTYLSFLHNLPSLNKIAPDDWVEIHPDTANVRNIIEGDIVKVKSPFGEISLKAKITEKVDSRIVMIPYGWGHKFNSAWQLSNKSEAECVNYLLDHKIIDKDSGIPAYKSMICEVSKL